MIYHVAKSGSNQNNGSADAPLLTIQKAADTAAMAGDEIVIHEGVYWEWVSPKRGGVNDCCRITYRAADKRSKQFIRRL